MKTSAKTPRLALAVAIAALLPAGAHAVDIGTLHCNDVNGVPLQNNQVVTVRGITTGTYPTGTATRLFIQDATGGINIFGTPQYCGAMGEELEVTGTVIHFNGLVELSSTATLPLSVTLLSSGNPQPAPVVQTPLQMNNSYQGDNCEPNESRLVRVGPVYVRTATGGVPTGTYSAQTNYMLISTGPDSLTNNCIMRVVQTTNPCGILNPVVGQPIIASCAFNVTGIVQQFDSTAPHTTGYQLTPRAPADLQILPGCVLAPAPVIAYSLATNNIRIGFNVELNAADAQTTSHYSLSTFQVITAAVYDNTSKSVTLTIGTPLVPSVTPHVVSMSGIRSNLLVAMDGVQTIDLIGGISTIPFIQTPVSPTNDRSRVENQQVTLRGIVTETTLVDFPSTIAGFYMQQAGTTDYAGIFVFTPPFMPNRGDDVLVSGQVVEFLSGTEYWTEISSIDHMQVVATGQPPVTPINVVPANLTGVENDADAERFESSLVKLSGVTTLTTASFGEPFEVAAGLAGTDIVPVDDLAIEESAYAPWRGDVVDVIGIVRFSASPPLRRLQPRNWSEPPTGDIHVISKTNTSDVPPSVVRRFLAQNEPNPFNPMTRISYAIEIPGRASLRVYDLQGRLVATLLDADAKAGPGFVEWNGRDSHGRQVPTGVYVYRLTSADGELSRKMVMLK